MIKRQQPGIWSCGVGTVAGMVVWVVISLGLFFMGPLLGIVFDVVLFVPEQLGVIDRLGKDEKIEIVIPGEQEIELGRVGIYHVYGEKEKTPAFEVTLTSQTTGERVFVRRVVKYHASDLSDPKSGAPYSLGADYNPLYEFQVDKAGLYSISATPRVKTSRQWVAWVAPSIPLNSDLVLISSILVQGLLVLGVLRLIYYLRHRTEIQAAQATRSARSDKFSAWMNERRDQD